MNTRFGFGIVVAALLFTLGAAFSKLAVAQVALVKATVAYRQVDGHDILADDYRPPGYDVRPVIVWIHGGALIMGHREGINSQVRATAEQLAKHKVPHRLVPIQGGEHGFGGGDPHEIEAAYQTMREFIARHLEAK